MREILAALLVAAAGVAGAQTAAPAGSMAPSPERPAQAGESGASGLNLKLDDPAGGRPRIQFGPRQGTQGSEAAGTLPDLGAGPGKAPSFDRPFGSGGRIQRDGGPIPKDTNPNI